MYTNDIVSVSVFSVTWVQGYVRVRVKWIWNSFVTQTHKKEQHITCVAPSDENTTIFCSQLATAASKFTQP